MALVTQPFTSLSVLAAAALLVTGVIELAAVPLSPSALSPGWLHCAAVIGAVER